jgi:hypothetical protein
MIARSPPRRPSSARSQQQVVDTGRDKEGASQRAPRKLLCLLPRRPSTVPLTVPARPCALCTRPCCAPNSRRCSNQPTRALSAIAIGNSTRNQSQNQNLPATTATTPPPASTPRAHGGPGWMRRPCARQPRIRREQLAVEQPRWL